MAESTNQALIGLNIDNIPSEIKGGELTYALNANVESRAGNSVTYQNEQSNELCLQYPEGYQVIAIKNIIQNNKVLYWLTNPITKDSEIGYTENENCIYNTLISDKNNDCKFNFSIEHPILQIIVKNTNCSTQVYWADQNARRYIDLDNLPWKEQINPDNDFEPIKLIGQLDCNKLNVQPNFDIPLITPKSVNIGGQLVSGTYQFAIQYSNENGEGYTSYYGVTNPTSIFGEVETNNFNISTSRSIDIEIENIDTSEIYQYFNIAVIKTINNITSVELIGTFPINSSKFRYNYTGEVKSNIRLSIDDIFEKFPYYDIAEGLYEVDNQLGWDKLKTNSRLNYQSIWSKVKVYWETYKVPYNKFEGYNNGINTSLYKGYLRDEIYALEGCFKLKNGKQTDSFHIPGRSSNNFDTEVIDNNDSKEIINTQCEEPTSKPRWQVYNTGSVIDYTKDYKDHGSHKTTITKTVDKYNATISGKINLVCFRAIGCGNGIQTIKITFDTPTPQGGINIKFGYIWHKKDTIEYYAIGWDGLYDIPAGVYLDTFNNHNYSSTPPNLATPFNVYIPEGMTEIYLSGGGTSTQSNSIIFHHPNYPTKNVWCNFCEEEITHFYITTECCKSNFRVVAETDNSGLDDVQYLLDNGKHPVNIRTHNINVPCATNTITSEQEDSCYIGSYQYGNMGYWESTKLYPKNPLIWEDLAGTPIRHHKIPDAVISPIHDNVPIATNGEFLVEPESYEHFIYPIGLKIDINSLYDAIKNSNLSQEDKDAIQGFEIIRGNRKTHESIIAKGILNNVGRTDYLDEEGKNPKTSYYPNYPYNDLRPDPYYSNLKLERTEQNRVSDSYGGLYDIGLVRQRELNGFDVSKDSSVKERFTFHSPDTHFYQPSISNQGQHLKLETVEYGNSYGHFIAVDKNAQYKFLTSNIAEASGAIARAAGLTIGAGTFGSPEFNVSALIPGFNSSQELFEKLATYTNFGYTYNSVGYYSNSYYIPNNGNKIRNIEYNKYIIDGKNSIEDGNSINNIRRESSIYIKTDNSFPYPYEYDTKLVDNSRYTISSYGGDITPDRIRKANIASYYGSIKRLLPSQYDEIYSYESISTGYYHTLYNKNGSKLESLPVVFGGDTFINRFALKTKQSIFKYTTVGQYDGQDIAYNEIGNINYPMFWISTKAANYNINIQKEVDAMIDQVDSSNFGNIIGNLFTGGALGSFTAIKLLAKIFEEIKNKIGLKNINVDNFNVTGITEEGITYLFVYGIPYYFCESEVNIDYRQISNAKEGDFYPNVGGSIPDDWLQEINVPIIKDNSYIYNQTYSKQNKENYFSHLREDYDPNKKCLEEFPNRTIWSDKSSLEETKNNWLIYRPISYYDFPKSYGDLTSIDRIEHNQLLVRFTNKSQLYNTLTTVDVNNAPNAYLGRNILFGAVPLDLSDTDSGDAGSQHKMFIKTPFGNIFVDALRGQVILLAQNNKIDLADKGLDKWFSEYLPFKIKEYYPEVNIDNNYNGIGLHGTYDALYKRLILTKLDYEPLDSENTIYSEGIFYTIINDLVKETATLKEININDEKYFCNKSWTLSYNFLTGSWISYHSYQPNYYIAFPNYFQSGIKNSLWNHNLSYNSYTNFYNLQYPYILEYPFVFKYNDQIVQAIKDYSTVKKYSDFYTFYEPDKTLYYNKSIIYNGQQCSGVVELIPKNSNDLSSYNKYPKYLFDKLQTQVTKSDNFYNFNQFWDRSINKSVPNFVQTCATNNEDKKLNTTNIDYSNKTFKKSLIRSKDCKVRMILDNDNSFNIISKFIINENTESYK